MGVPIDAGASNRPGARFGPRQIRTESVLVRGFNKETGSVTILKILFILLPHCSMLTAFKVNYYFYCCPILFAVDQNINIGFC